jgi:hypothetical protein
MYAPYYPQSPTGEATPSPRSTPEWAHSGSEGVLDSDCTVVAKVTLRTGPFEVTCVAITESYYTVLPMTL